jgi:type I restriction enzyme S subunit
VLPAGSLLVTTRATIGALAIAGVPVTTNQGFKNIVLGPNADPEFYFYLLQRVAAEMKRLASGSTFDEISKREFAAIIVPRPPVPEQRRIAELLNTADEAIRQTEALIAKLKQMKRGLFHDLLTRGLNENGELRDPVAHPEQFRDSPLGQMPQEWATTLIGDLAIHVGSGVTPRGGSDVYQNSGILFIRSQNVTFEGLLLDDVAYISERIHASMSRSEIYPNDVLLNITGASIGRCCPVPVRFGTANVNQHVCAIRVPNATPADAHFLSAVLASSIGQSQIDRLNAGGNREGLNYAQIRSFVVPWPRSKERTRIAGALSAHESRIRAEEVYRDKLQLLKKGLMQDLLTGRVRVPVSEGEPELIEAGT